MDKKEQAVARFISTMLCNVAAIGFAFAVYDQRWCTLFGAVIVAVLGGYVAWRSA